MSDVLIPDDANMALTRYGAQHEELESIDRLLPTDRMTVRKIDSTQSDERNIATASAVNQKHSKDITI